MQRRDGLATDRIRDRLLDDLLDQHPVRTVERPARNTERRLYLRGVTAAPERNVDTLVEHP